MKKEISNMKIIDVDKEVKMEEALKESKRKETEAPTLRQRQGKKGREEGRNITSKNMK